MERLGDPLELPVLQEPVDELLPRVGSVPAFDRRVPREDHLALDLDEERLDVEELRGDLEVQLHHEDEVLVVLPADVDHRDVPQVDLVLPDQVEEEVERPVELRQVDRVGLDELRAGGNRDPDAFGHGVL